VASIVFSSDVLAWRADSLYSVGVHKGWVWLTVRKGWVG